MIQSLTKDCDLTYYVISDPTLVCQHLICYLTSQLHHIGSSIQSDILAICLQTSDRSRILPSSNLCKVRDKGSMWHIWREKEGGTAIQKGPISFIERPSIGQGYLVWDLPFTRDPSHATPCQCCCWTPGGLWWPKTGLPSSQWEYWGNMPNTKF